MTELQTVGQYVRHCVANAQRSAEHGTRTRYQGGCKCVRCRAANSQYEQQRSVARKAGQGNGLVPADKARKHLFRLSKANVGTKSVSEVTGVAIHTLVDIRLKRKTQIRRSTEAKILSVTTKAVAGGAVVSAKRTWVLIGLMLKEGFTKGEIARRLGYKYPQLSFSKDRITANTAAKVERLYTLTMQI
jgi:hypothetical protein